VSIDTSYLAYGSDLGQDSSVIFDFKEDGFKSPTRVPDLNSYSEEFLVNNNEFADDSESDEAISNAHHRNITGKLPDVVIQLQKDLLGDYTLPPCPDKAPPQYVLSRAEKLSLQHYFAWTESHGTVKAYNAHARVLAGATKEEILSLFKVRQLAV